MKLRKLWGLSRWEWFWLIRSYLAFPSVLWQLRRGGYKAARERLSRRLAAVRRVAAVDPDRLARVVRIAADYHWLRVSCVPRSLWLWYVLERHGMSSEIRFGVTSKQVDHLSAHAWVEYQGRPLNEPPDVGRRYARFR